MDGVREALVPDREDSAGKCTGVQTGRMCPETRVSGAFIWLRQRAYVGENRTKEEENSFSFQLKKTVISMRAGLPPRSPGLTK